MAITRTRTTAPFRRVAKRVPCRRTKEEVAGGVGGPSSDTATSKSLLQIKTKKEVNLHRRPKRIRRREPECTRCEDSPRMPNRKPGGAHESGRSTLSKVALAGLYEPPHALSNVELSGTLGDLVQPTYAFTTLFPP
ncbi:hypothetical protein KM043_003375 [Ampulex compressa]|nr:hypothetical protein KM043_003375 [Ampulex compressa]